MKNLSDGKVTEAYDQVNPIRVMHLVLNLEIGGAQEVVRTLVKYLAKEGHKPVVCTFKDGPLRQEIEKLGVPVEILPDRRYSFLAFPLFVLEMFRIRNKLIQLIRKHQIDIIQTHLLQSLDFLVATLHRLSDSPTIYWTIHNYNFALQSDDLPRFRWLLHPKHFAYRILYNLFINWVDGIIAVSSEVEEAILETIGPVAKNKIKVICNAVDLDRYQKSMNQQFLRDALGLGNDTRLMLVVAMLKEQKGHRYLIDAAAKVLPRFPDLHILLIGDGILKEELGAQTNALGLEKQIHFLGMREDIPDLLADGDYFVLPSLWEGLPVALIEAMATGLPVIATEVSGSKQVVFSGATGLLIPPGDSQKLADAIEEIITQPQWASEMGQAARRRIEEKYNASKQVREYIDLYRKRYLTSNSW